MLSSMAGRLLGIKSFLSRISSHYQCFNRSISIQATGQTASFDRNNVPRLLTLVAFAGSGYAYHSIWNIAEADASVQKKAQPSANYKNEHQAQKPELEIEPESQEVINWSGTHSVTTDRFYQPETFTELKAIVKHAHETRQHLRPVGSCLSPNGLPFSQGGMICLANMDEIISVDTKTNRVTIQAGARVSQVVEALRPHGLTLQNFASITEQQMGGFTQVGAHGTGVAIPPVDEQVFSILMVSPALGEIYLSAEDEDPSLFQLARTSLGLLGVVAEVTIQCVPAHKLIEHTFVLSRSQVSEQHRELLAKNRHLRYMWIPYTDDVIVVTCNPVKPGEEPEPPSFSDDKRLTSARQLLIAHPKCKLTDDRIAELTFTALRDELLALDPLNVEWLKKVNSAEAEFWRRSKGARIDWSDKILQFDCGGQQWVSEIAFPVSKGSKTNPDINYMFSLLDMIEQKKIATPAPLEQRWSAPSISPMSPASEKPGRELAEFYSWVGIIMYLPDAESDPGMRRKITEAFKKYKQACEEHLWPQVSAVEHWAKIEIPQTDKEKALLQQRTAQKYPVDAFKAICKIFDPHGILRNELTDNIFGAAD